MVSFAQELGIQFSWHCSFYKICLYISMQLQKILKNLNLWKGSTNIPMQGFLVVKRYTSYTVARFFFLTKSLLKTSHYILIPPYLIYENSLVCVFSFFSSHFLEKHVPERGNFSSLIFYHLLLPFRQPFMFLGQYN